MSCLQYKAVTSCPMWPTTIRYRELDVISRNFGDGVKVSLGLRGAELVQTYPIKCNRAGDRFLVPVVTKTDLAKDLAVFQGFIHLTDSDTLFKHPRFADLQSLMPDCLQKSKFRYASMRPFFFLTLDRYCTVRTIRG